MLGGEIAIHLPRSQRRIVRALCGDKPFCTLVKADFNQVSPAAIETFMRRCVAYAMLPGFFDITPSGDHPGSSYWLHPEWYDRDRPLFRRYLPLAAELARAGWQPVPSASVDGAAFVERFGGGPVSYLTVSTDPAEDLAVRQAITVRPAFAQAGDLAVELLTGRVVADARVIRGELSPEDLAVWAIGTPDALAAAARDRAQDVLARRGSYLLASRTRDGGLTPWTPMAKAGARGRRRSRRRPRPASRTAAGQDFAGASRRSTSMPERRDRSP